MRRVSQMAAAFIRLVTTFGLLFIVVAVAWTSLFISARFSRGLHNGHVLDAADNRTWKPAGRLLTAGADGQFYLNGRPKRLIGGEFHYFRVHPAHWDDRLRRMRTAGLNTVTTRVPWNVHERRPAAFQFRGGGGLWNLAEFIRLVHRLGFLLVVHVGPYVDADWEFGGLPAWLLNDRHMAVRTATYRPFVESVRRYFKHLLRLLDRWTYRKHGPIIALQVTPLF